MNEPLEMTWVFSDTQYTVVAIAEGCENQGTAEFWKDQGRSTQRTANLSHAPFTEFSLRQGVGVTILSNTQLIDVQVSDLLKISTVQLHWLYPKY